jgi:5-methylcytosine-specific restriction endonuclease McrA
MSEVRRNSAVSKVTTCRSSQRTAISAPSVLERLLANKPYRRRLNEIEKAWEIHRREIQESSTTYKRRQFLSKHIANQQNKCAYCGVPMSRTGSSSYDSQATLDHVVARSLGGEDTEENTVAACRACNSSKDDLPLENFLMSGFFKARRLTALTPPVRMCADPSSPFYSAWHLDRGIRVFLDDKELFEVEEYSIPEGWIRISAGKARTRLGRPVTVTRKGRVRAEYRDLGPYGTW